MSRIYTTKIPSLKATFADIRNIGAKNITLNGKNILDYINDSTPTVKHAQDTRETVTENDLWGQLVETQADGTIVVHDDWVTNPNASSTIAWNSTITKVADNKAYVGDEPFANIQTERIQDGSSMFYGCKNLTTFSSDLSSLEESDYMFYTCTKLTSFDSDLSKLKSGSYMFAGCSGFISFSHDLPSLMDGFYMFAACSKLTSFSHYLPSLKNGGGMFNNCVNLTKFISDLSSLTMGAGMFNKCSKLEVFSSDLHNLTNGFNMFNTCKALDSFFFDIPNLTNGGYMFNGCLKLTSFSSDVSSLTNGNNMFSDCSQLKSFSSDVSNLVNGNNMFLNCKILTSFNGDLSSLTDGTHMFSKCKLDAKSVMYIADTIKDITAEKQLYTNGTIPYVTLTTVGATTKGFMSDGSYLYFYDDYYNNKSTYHTAQISPTNVGKLTLGINVSDNADTIQQQLEDFAKAATFDSWSELKQAFVDKGWTVYFQYGDTGGNITYDLRNGEQIIPCQIFAKLVQVEDKDSAEYCTEDASTFYNIEWGHDITDTSDYTQFNSLEDAMASWNVFPKENIITAEE